MNRRPARGRLLDWKASAGLLLSAVLLWFAFRGVDGGAVLAEIRSADPLYFAVAVFFATAVFAVRAARWAPLLAPVRADVPFHSRFAATNIGFMVNNLLPARVGEFVRAYALSRMERLPLVASFGSLVVERTLDGLTVVAFLFIAMALPGFPDSQALAGRDIGGAARAIAVVFGLCAALLMLLVLSPVRSVHFAERIARRVLPGRVRRLVVDGLEAFLAGLASLRDPVLLVRSVLWSIAVWLVGGLSFWFAFRAFELNLPISAALFMQSLIGLAVALPSAPGFFGVWEAAAKVGLVELWGAPVHKALGFAVGFHMGGFVPVTVIGLWYAWRAGLSWHEVGASEEIVEEAVEESIEGERGEQEDRSP